mgnify:CR=1 FL=1
MDYELTRHAKERMAERHISEKLLENVILYPSKVLYDEKNKIMFKKLYAGDKRLLIIIAERIKNKLKIITVIDTSKIKL